jgi:hypothetical protein
MQDPTTPSTRLQFDPTINAGHVLTFIGFIITGFIGWQALDKRIVALEEARKTQQQVDRHQDQVSDMNMRNIERSLVEIKDQIREVNQRLERVRP